MTIKKICAGLYEGKRADGLNFRISKNEQSKMWNVLADGNLSGVLIDDAFTYKEAKEMVLTSDASWWTYSPYSY